MAAARHFTRATFLDAPFVRALPARRDFCLPTTHPTPPPHTPPLPACCAFLHIPHARVPFPAHPTTSFLLLPFPLSPFFLRICIQTIPFSSVTYKRYTWSAFPRACDKQVLTTDVLLFIWWTASRLYGHASFAHWLTCFLRMYSVNGVVLARHAIVDRFHLPLSCRLPA